MADSRRATRLWLILRFTICTLNQYEHRRIAVYDCLLSCHSNKCPYLNANHLGNDEKFSRANAMWSRLPQYATTCSYIHCRSKFGNSTHKTSCDSPWTQQEPVWIIAIIVVTCAVCVRVCVFVTGDCKWKTDRIPGMKLPTFMCIFSIIRGTLTVPSIISRSVLTAAAHYKETDQTMHI